MSERQVVTLCEAYLLHARPYRDSSAIADFFTKDFGRIAVVARGARRPKSKIRSSLRPFQAVLLSWTTRGSLGTLTALETAGSLTSISGKCLLSAYYVNELIMRALRSGDSHAEVFALYKQVLSDLENNNEQCVLRLFERDLLDCLGYGLQLDSDHLGQPIDEHVQYSYDVQEGLIPVDNNPQAVSLSGASVIQLAERSLISGSSLRDTKRLLRYVLDFHLGERASKVRDVLTSMQARRRTWQPVDLPENGRD